MPKKAEMNLQRKDHESVEHKAGTYDASTFV